MHLAKHPDRLEWIMACVLIVVGVHILLFPAVVAISHMRLILDVMPAEMLGLTCLGVGGLRLATLIWHPAHITLRLVCTLAAILLWGEMTVDFAWRVMADRGLAPPGLDMLAAQWVGELWLFWELALRR